MNCTKGCLAVYVGSPDYRHKPNPNHMRVVRCLEYRGQVKGKRGNDLWKINKPLVVRRGPRIGGNMYFADDSQLLPLSEDKATRTAELVAIKLTLFK